MRLALAALVALALVPAAHGDEKAPKGKKPNWQTDYAKARAEAARAKKLLFVVFRCQP